MLLLTGGMGQAVPPPLFPKIRKQNTMAFNLDNILAQSTITGADRRKILKKVVKADDASDIRDIFDAVNQRADTKLTRNLAAAIVAIANARFPKEWAEVAA